MPVERDTALKALHERINNIEMHHKMIAAVTSTGSAKVPPWRRVFLRVDASLSGEPVAALLGVEQTIRMENFFLPGTFRWGLPFLMKMVIP